jgi:hypothetical protein
MTSYQVDEATKTAADKLLYDRIYAELRSIAWAGHMNLEDVKACKESGYKTIAETTNAIIAQLNKEFFGIGLEPVEEAGKGIVATVVTAPVVVFKGTLDGVKSAVKKIGSAILHGAVMVPDSPPKDKPKEVTDQ